ncbi:MAG TPA: hypothetical protein DEP18_06300 [Flavobacteriales bacterium]|nr:hypothetical protein [Flavobacteriales bacterium]HCA83381.1 hypothetical protein [Flavobacteriales bacterium]HRE74052.1 DUF4924 family protein [Flavobacteriales bacterium]HRE95915.1 DUF4924 family protein [Flavobacteriales bacterium]HRJ34426.1 DUF4924 family protein [Flavobacteriales bacterium]
MRAGEEKLKKNIAEYILYIWQMEDLVRSFQFDANVIRQSILSPQIEDEKELELEMEWFNELIRKMKNQQLVQKGHLNELNEIIQELFYLHNTLLNVAKDQAYVALNDAAAEAMEEFRFKSKLNDMNTVELCLNGLYLKLLMRLSKQEITSATETAFDSFRKLIAYLTIQYHKMKNGDLQFNYNLN